MKKINYLYLICIILGVAILTSCSNVFSMSPNLKGKEAPTPKITVSENNQEKNLVYEYASNCWNTSCENTADSKQLQPNLLKVDSTIYIDWKQFKEEPNVIILENKTTGEKIVYHLSDKDMTIQISNQANPYEYCVTFYWYRGQANDLLGMSTLEFAVQAQSNE